MTNPHPEPQAQAQAEAESLRRQLMASRSRRPRRVPEVGLARLLREVYLVGATFLVLAFLGLLLFLQFGGELGPASDRKDWLAPPSDPTQRQPTRYRRLGEARARP